MVNVRKRGKVYEYSFDVADVLGHKDIETTENYYISSTDENKKNVSNVFDNLMTSETINNIIKYKIAY